MHVLGIALILLGAATYVGSIVAYAKASWYANCDLMGASMVFTLFWTLGTLLVFAGLIAASLLGFWPAVMASVGLSLAGKLLEWFGIEPLLSRVFPKYRRGAD